MVVAVVVDEGEEGLVWLVRKAAIAALAPLPPRCREKDVASRDSPMSGRRSVTVIWSTIRLPMTVMVRGAIAGAWGTDSMD